MDDYSINFARSARKELAALPESVVQRILPRVEALARAPRPSGCRKLTGQRDLWRLRVGDYRVIYSIDDSNGIIDVNAVRHRRDAYL